MHCIAIIENIGSSTCIEGSKLTDPEVEMGDAKGCEGGVARSGEE
jgi:hypothetical protein